jgi:hypothetical protein
MIKLSAPTLFEQGKEKEVLEKEKMRVEIRTHQILSCPGHWLACTSISTRCELLTLFFSLVLTEYKKAEKSLKQFLRSG